MPPAPTQWIDLFERLGTTGLGVLAGLALVASYFDIWGWTRQHQEEMNELREQHKVRVADLLNQLAEVKASEQRWMKTTMDLLNPVVRAVDDRLARKGG